MPALDLIHNAVKNALIKDGWNITADPYVIVVGGDKLYVDLAAEQRLAAERDGQKIAVEIESFSGRSPIREFEIALGQYMLYVSAIEQTDPERKMYLAISAQVYEFLFQRVLIRNAVQRYQISLLVILLETEEVAQWIN